VRPLLGAPGLTTYDRIEVSSSGGKDSFAMKAHVARLARRAGVLDRVVVVHADLGRVEWPGTPELVEAQAKHLGLRFMKVKRPQGDLLDQVEKLGKWPMPTQRFCTADHKRGQIYCAFTELADAIFAVHALAGPGLKRPVRILNCVGLRAEESAGRAKRPALARDLKSSGKGTRKIVDVWLPIQNWTEAEVWAACRASGAPIHPAYAAGLPRASCVFCIFAPEAALQIAGLAHPELLAEYVRVEKKIGHTFKRHLPIAKVAADLAAGVRPTGHVDSWCM
jgi:3'-phosphoadenosine 5'-phosphosulfate sulfotransferase (PAPS reductase)/FAD synthetase